MPAIRKRLAVILGSGFVLLAAGLLASLPPGHASASPQEDQTVLALKGAQIHTMTDQGTITGTVIVRDGKIEAVGPDLPIPDGAREIDLAGHTIVPGLIDSRSVLWLTQAARGETSTRGALTILDGVDPYGEDWREVARQGVTAVYVQPDGRSTLGGEGAVLRVAPASSVEELVVKGSAAVQASLGVTGATSRERYAQFQRLKTAIENVKKGKKVEAEADEEAEEEEEEATPRRGGIPRGFGRGGNRGGGRGRAASQPDRTEEVLGKVVSGEIPLRLEVHHPDTLIWALSLASELDIRIVLEGVSLPGGALSKLEETRTPLVLGPVRESGSAPSYREDRDEDWIEKVSRATGLWALGSFAGDGRSSRLLRVQAAAAVAAGLEPEAVLRAMTVDAARILGVSDQLGTIAPGRPADLAVFAGDPLDPSVSARLVLSGGEVVYEGRTRLREVTKRGEVKLPESLPARYAIRSSRVLQDGKLTPATLIIRGGQLEALGADIDVPSEITVFDIGDGVVTPGLVAAHAYLGQGGSLSDTTESDASQFRAIDIVDPESDTAKALLDGGFVHVAYPPASQTTSAGVVGALRLGTSDIVAAPSIASKFVLASSARNDERWPASLAGQRGLLSDLLGGRPSETRIYLPTAAQKALVAERQRNVQAVVQGKRVALFAAETRPEIAAALDLIGAHHLAAALVGPGELVDFIDRIRALGVGVIARPITGSDTDRYAEQIAAAGVMDIPVAFAGDSAHEIRMTAALAVEAGLPVEAALRGLTSGAARMVGMPPSTATFTVGRPADLVLWNDSPLNLSARPVRVIVGGNVVEPE
ncbi:MAG: amidohydrolase family protein [Planctomycetota bacterium]